jgi:RNA-directed DNA polymerase
MQGSPLSPLLANIALHGLEKTVADKFPRKRNGSRPPYVVRYADDFVVLHDDLAVIQRCEQMVNEWLAPIGLRLKPSKTRITHTLAVPNGKAGFDFLGFNVRQYPAGKRKSGKNTYGRTLGYKTIIKPSTTAVKRHVEKLREIITRYQHTDQATLIKALNPVIRGWSNYHSTAVSSEVFHKLSGHVLFSMLWSWAKFRHSSKGKKWIVNKYWHVSEGNGWLFRTPDKESQLYLHHETPIRRHVKIEGTSSPYDGRMVYWSTKLGRHPEIPPRVAKLFKKQKGRCTECELFFREEDLLEMDHIIPKQYGGSDALYNRQLLHRHCHDVKTARDACVAG